MREQTARNAEGSRSRGQPPPPRKRWHRLWWSSGRGARGGMTMQRWTHESGEQLSRRIECWARRTATGSTAAAHQPRSRNSVPTCRPRREPMRRSHSRCDSPPRWPGHRGSRGMPHCRSRLNSVVVARCPGEVPRMHLCWRKRNRRRAGHQSQLCEGEWGNRGDENCGR
jgi:hypothetical protein